MLDKKSLPDRHSGIKMNLMKNLILSIMCFGVLIACKHDHPHAPDGSHISADGGDGHSGHDHGDEHSHDTHDHNGHSHDDGHDHSGHEHDAHDHEGHSHSDQSSSHNALSAQEKSEGWTLLFDGQKINEWTGYKSGISSKWTVSDGTIYFNPKADGAEGDILTKKEYEDFELVLDWKISNCGNSGIFWNVVQDERFDRTYQSAPEMQILDNKCHPDAKIQKHKAGDLYDLIETSSMTVKPAMEWNSIRIVSKDSHYQFYQNGVKVVEFTMHDENWDKMIADSKFKQWPGFGEAKRGHLALQDHDDEVWFRNIKIREI